MPNEEQLSILVIDDNEMTRAALRAILHSEKTYQVIGEATNGESGLELARKLRPDIICLDIIMPKSDGLDVLEQLKNSLDQSMVLMVTASNDRQTVETAVQRGASGFIIKPFNAGVVLDTMEQAAARLRALKRKPSLESED